MEKHIYSALVETKFYCIQPLYIDIELLSKIITVHIDIESIKKSNKDNPIPVWINEMNELFNLYNSFVSLKTEFKFNFQNFKDELSEKEFLINSKFSLANYISEQETNFYILFDFRLLQFVVVYEIGFWFPKADLTELLQHNKSELDLYNCIRNIYVKEGDNSCVIDSVFKLKESILLTAKTFLESNFFVTPSSDSITILNNTGNITNVTIIEDKDPKLCRRFIDLNFNAERIPNTKPPILLDSNGIIGAFREENYKNELLYFNGRFHTIILHSNKTKYRYLPIQFHMQYLWFYLSKQINHILEKFNDDIIFDESNKNIAKYNENINLLINKVEIMGIYHQKFKLSLESDCDIFESIQQRWNIENMLSSSNSYILFFKDYLNRLYNKKTTKIEQKQNKLLFFISIFQFVALISVWNDYVSLLDDESKDKADEIIPLFGNSNNFEQFNLYLPLSFAMIIIIMIYYVFFTKNSK